MAHDVKLVEQDRRLWRPFPRRVAKRLPHVHHRQANAAALLLAQPIVELRHARLRAIFPAEPDRPPADQVAHHDTVAMALADRDLVDADRLGPRPARAGELGMYCFSNVLTVSQSSFSSSAMSLIVACRQRWPT